MRWARPFTSEERGADGPLEIELWRSRTPVPYVSASERQKAHALLVSQGRARPVLWLLEHERVVTVGKSGGEGLLRVSPDVLRERNVDYQETDRGGKVTYHGPGQLVGYPLIPIQQVELARHVRLMEEMLIRTLAEFGIDAWTDPPFTGVWTEKGKIAAIGVRLSKNVTTHGFALNVAPDLGDFGLIIPCGLEGKQVTSMQDFLGNRTPGMDKVAERLVSVFCELYETSIAVEREIEPEGETVQLPERNVPHRDRMKLVARYEEGIPGRKPSWLKVPIPSGVNYLDLKSRVAGLGLNTVCESAGCPNIGECWERRSLTLMILGHTCTRRCGFCDVATGRPAPVDPDEPSKVAGLLKELGLSYAVITSVDRDDLPDGGASHWASVIRAVREGSPGMKIEVLVPDFQGNRDSQEAVFGAQPDVLAHNIETVPRLTRLVRPQARYERSMEMLGRSSGFPLLTKSGLMLGLGETDEEVIEVMKDLRKAGVGIVTLGQYLRPSVAHLPVTRWVTPEQFVEFKRYGEVELGFLKVESGPLVRSSYHADVSGMVALEKVASG